MGAWAFTTTALGRTAGDAYRAADEQARWEDGNSGYTGTIAEKSGYVLFNLPAGMTARKMLDLITESEGNDPDDMRYLREDLAECVARLKRGGLTREQRSMWIKQRNQAQRLITECERDRARFVKKAGRNLGLVQQIGSVYNDKWGPAVCFEITGAEARDAKKRAGRAGTRDHVFMFCGYASS